MPTQKSTSGQTGLVITYHETQADAENNVNAITGRLQ